VVAAAVVAVVAVATGTKPERVCTRRGCLSGSPAISFLELPINSMRFSALCLGQTVQSQEVCLYKEFYVYVC
jgi:hypothetical protein